MKINKAFTMFLALLMFCCFTFGALAESEPAVTADEAAPAEATESETTESDESLAEWTVMLYLCGTDLETEHAMATTNLVEIAKTVPNEKVNFVIQTGGALEWHAQSVGLDINPDKCQRYHYDENGYTLDEELPLLNMANGETLADFVKYAAEHYPAKKNLLVLWDHGGGSYGGLIQDQRHQYAIMSLEQMELALNRTGVHFEATMLDTCLMASLETAQALQSSTHYFIASEETVPGQGTDYYSWLQYLYDMPECDGRLFGRRICDSVQQKYAELGSSHDYNSITFSLVDLTRLDPVVTAFNAMFKELRAKLDDPTEMAAFGSVTARTECYSYGMLDIGDLVTRARGMGVSNQTANALLSALADAVIYNIRGVDHSYSTGLSFYYEPTTSSAKLDHFARSCKNAEYLAFIDRLNIGWSAPAWVYEQVEYLPDITYDDYIVETSSELREDGKLQLTITNAGNAVQSLGLTLYAYFDPEDESEEIGTWVCIGNDFLGIEEGDKPDTYTALIRGKAAILGDAPCEPKVLQENVDYVLYQVPIWLETKGKNYNLLVMYRYDESLTSQIAKGGLSGELSYDGSYSILGVQVGTNNALPSRAVISLNDFFGQKFAPVYTQVYFPEGNDNGTETGELQEFTEDIEIDETELEPGRYAASFYIKDIFGNVTKTEMMPFTWDGTNAVFDVPEPEQQDDDVQSEETPAESEQQDDVVETEETPAEAAA